MDRQMIQSEQEKMERILGKILRYGIFLSLLFLIFGLILSLIQHTESQIEVGQLESFQLFDYLSSHSIFDGVTMMIVGVSFLIVTPILRVISTFILFVMAKDRLYICITTLVMLIIFISIILGFIVEPR